MKARALIFVVTACGHKPDAITPKDKGALPPSSEIALDSSLKAQRRMVPAEAFLRAYLTWFGGLAPAEVIQRTQRSALLDRWSSYMTSIGLPDYQFDMPRATESNPVMLATFGRLAEALCVKSAEHDLHDRPRDGRVVFDFEPMTAPSLEEFKPRFDVLHRTFLGYPAELAPPHRIERFWRLYQKVAANHAVNPDLTADELGWVAVCTALVQHPETGLY
jgi:hypothetical protein